MHSQLQVFANEVVELKNELVGLKHEVMALNTEVVGLKHEVMELKNPVVHLNNERPADAVDLNWVEAATEEEAVGPTTANHDPAISIMATEEEAVVPPPQITILRSGSWSQRPCRPSTRRS